MGIARGVAVGAGDELDSRAQVGKESIRQVSWSVFFLIFDPSSEVTCNNHPCG